MRAGTGICFGSRIYKLAIRAACTGNRQFARGVVRQSEHSFTYALTTPTGHKAVSCLTFASPLPLTFGLGGNPSLRGKRIPT